MWAGCAADNRVYALKQINLEGMNRVEREESIDEVRALPPDRAPQRTPAAHHPRCVSHVSCEARWAVGRCVPPPIASPTCTASPTCPFPAPLA